MKSFNTLLLTVIALTLATQLGVCQVNWNEIEVDRDKKRDICYDLAINNLNEKNYYNALLNINEAFSVQVNRDTDYSRFWKLASLVDSLCEGETTKYYSVVKLVHPHSGEVAEVDSFTFYVLGDYDPILVKCKATITNLSYDRIPAYQRSPYFVFWRSGSQATIARALQMADQFNSYGEFGGDRKYFNCFIEPKSRIELVFTYHSKLSWMYRPEETEGKVKAMKRILVKACLLGSNHILFTDAYQKGDAFVAIGEVQEEWLRILKSEKIWRLDIPCPSPSVTRFLKGVEDQMKLLD